MKVTKFMPFSLLLVFLFPFFSSSYYAYGQISLNDWIKPDGRVTILCTITDYTLQAGGDETALKNYRYILITESKELTPYELLYCDDGRIDLHTRIQLYYLDEHSNPKQASQCEVNTAADLKSEKITLKYSNDHDAPEESLSLKWNAQASRYVGKIKSNWVSQETAKLECTTLTSRNL